MIVMVRAFGSSPIRSSLAVRSSLPVSRSLTIRGSTVRIMVIMLNNHCRCRCRRLLTADHNEHGYARE
jgi:hypothetical protein